MMAMLLFVGYGAPCVCNLVQRDPSQRAPLPWAPAVSGIRNRALDTIIVNSLLETNTGLRILSS